MSNEQQRAEEARVNLAYALDGLFGEGEVHTGLIGPNPTEVWTRLSPDQADKLADYLAAVPGILDDSDQAEAEEWGQADEADCAICGAYITKGPDEVWRDAYGRTAIRGPLPPGDEAVVHDHRP